MTYRLEIIHFGSHIILSCGCSSRHVFIFIKLNYFITSIQSPNCNRLGLRRIITPNTICFNLYLALSNNRRTLCNTRCKLGLHMRYKNTQYVLILIITRHTFMLQDSLSIVSKYGLIWDCQTYDAFWFLQWYMVEMPNLWLTWR